jgi:hypothetical protein
MRSSPKPTGDSTHRRDPPKGCRGRETIGVDVVSLYDNRRDAINLRTASKRSPGEDGLPFQAKYSSTSPFARPFSQYEHRLSRHPFMIHRMHRELVPIRFFIDTELAVPEDSQSSETGRSEREYHI